MNCIVIYERGKLRKELYAPKNVYQISYRDKPSEVQFTLLLLVYYQERHPYKHRHIPKPTHKVGSISKWKSNLSMVSRSILAFIFSFELSYICNFVNSQHLLNYQSAKKIDKCAFFGRLRGIVLVWRLWSWTRFKCHLFVLVPEWP